MVVPVKLDIPEEYIKDVASGAIDISKAVLRDVDSGKIVKHIDLFVDNKDIAKGAIENVDSGKIVKHIDLSVDNKDTVKVVVENVGVKKLGVAGLVVGGIVLVGLGAYKIVNIFNKDKKIKMPKCITEFHKKLNKYLEEANKGILNADSIDDVLKTIDEIEKIKDPNIKIDFSTKEVRDLLNSVYKFTEELNKTDKNNKIKFKAPSKNSDDNVICLKDYLKYQKKLAVVG